MQLVKGWKIVCSLFSGDLVIVYENVKISYVFI